MEQITLMHVIGFTGIDLEENRQGRITEMQRSNLVRDYWKGITISALFSIFYALLVITVLVLMGLVFRAVFLGTPFFQWDNSLDFVILVAGLYLLCALVIQLMLSVSKWNQLENDLRYNKAYVTSGRISLDVPTHQKQNVILRRWSFKLSYTLEVNGLKFNISKKLWNVLVGNEKYFYTVYYLPNSKSLISIERL